LKTRAGFTYHGGRVVNSLTPTNGRILIGVTSRSGVSETIEARRVCVACGPLATARLILQSLDAHGRPLTLRHQPYFLLPMLGLAGDADVEAERLHTLSQVFIEITNARVAPQLVHLQLYTFNRFIRDRVDRLARLGGPFRAPLRRAVARRLVAVQGYLHSDTVPGIEIVSRASSPRARLELTAHGGSTEAVRRVVRCLKQWRTELGVTPLASMLTVGPPGDGNHCGSTFPMRDAPGPFETDITGQLPDLRGVHIVDSSVLPSLPATTLTYTVMANAYRIGRLVAQCGP
jgi:choline dehydrogenase-like flavoprotein